MSAVEDAGVVRTLIDALNRRDWDRFARSYAKDVALEHPAAPGPIVGSAKVLAYAKGLVADFPDLRVDPTRIFGQEGWVCVEARIASSLKGSPLSYPECVVLRVEQGRIIREAHYVDLTVFARGAGPSVPT